jgi:hypothetical protein
MRENAGRELPDTLRPFRRDPDDFGNDRLVEEIELPGRFDAGCFKRYTLLLGEQEYTPADKTEAYLTGTFPNVNHAPLIKP